MSQHNSLSIDDDLVFYVEEQADDFTFYLVRDEEDTIVKALKNKLKKSELIESGTGEMFSFAERVLVKPLTITKDNIRTPDDRFWANLVAAKADSQYKFLLDQLKSRGAASYFSPGSAVQSAADRKNILDTVIQVLNESVKGPSLENTKWTSKPLNKPAENFLNTLPENETKKRWRNRLMLEQAFPDLIEEPQAGRALVCFSYVGRYLSVTFRKLSKGKGYDAPAHRNKEIRQSYMFGLNEYCELVYREVFKHTGSTQHAQGLLVITGSTKSAKSEIARGLIQLYLTGKTQANRRHHLVTFEDPVERLFADHESCSDLSPWIAIPDSPDLKRTDYTPRQKQKDAGLLEEALSDALRQTPAIFFVGETRNSEEWKVLLNFAATGHLIVTTAHAGSLVEAMHKIFEALHVKTAADRNEVAAKLLSVIHLRSYDLEYTEAPPKGERAVPKKMTTNALFPAVWRRTPRGIASLTSDGLASLLPSRPRENETSGSNGQEMNGPSCLGRRWLIQQILEQTQTRDELESVFNDQFSPLRDQAYAKATEWDLRGV
jgi:hypothetical protein